MNTTPKAIIYQSPERSLYLGKLERQFKKSNITPILLISLDDELELLDANNQAIARSKSFLLPSGSSIAMDTHQSKVAMCFLDDLGKNFDLLSAQMTYSVSQYNQRVYFDSKANDQLIEHASYIEKCRPCAGEVSEVLNTWLNHHAFNQGYVCDERVALAVSLIKDHSEQNMSVAEIADKVSLSIPRLIQLFKQVTGTPIRRFRLWQRIFVTSEKLSTGLSLTDAAIEAGFSDYAHFSRTFRELGGGNPSDARDNTEIRMLAS